MPVAIDPRLAPLVQAFFRERELDPSSIEELSILVGVYDAYDGPAVERFGNRVTPGHAIRVLGVPIHDPAAADSAWQGQPCGGGGTAMDSAAAMPPALDPFPSAPTDRVPNEALEAGLLGAASPAGHTHACMDCKHWSIRSQLDEPDAREAWQGRRLDTGRDGRGCSSKRHFDDVHVDNRLTMGMGHWASSSLRSFFRAMTDDAEAWGALRDVLASWFGSHTSAWNQARADVGLPTGGTVDRAAVQALLEATVLDQDWIDRFRELDEPEAPDDETAEARREREAEAERVREHNATRHSRFDALEWLDEDTAMGLALRARAVARFQVDYWCTGHPVADSEERALRHAVRTLGGIASAISSESSGPVVFDDLDDENPDYEEGSGDTQWIGRVRIGGRDLDWMAIHANVEVDAAAFEADPDAFMQDWRALMIWLYYADYKDEIRLRMAAMWHQWFSETWGDLPTSASDLPRRHLGVHMQTLGAGESFASGYEGPWYHLDDQGRPRAVATEDSSAAAPQQHCFPESRFAWEPLVLTAEDGPTARIEEVQLVEGELYLLARVPFGRATDEGQPMVDALVHLIPTSTGADLWLIALSVLPTHPHGFHHLCFFDARSGLPRPESGTVPRGHHQRVVLTGDATGTTGGEATGVGGWPTDAPDPGSIYGGHDLRRGDDDTSKTYGGEARTGDPGGHVAQLRTDLTALGFGPMVGSTTEPGFDRALEFSVRELQIHAKMESLAREAAAGDSAASAERYVDRLSAVANDLVYPGPVSGVVDARTRSVIAHWLAQRYRCPVIIDAVDDGEVVTENLWRHDDHRTTAPRMYAKDFSGYWTLPAARAAEPFVVVGDWASYHSWNGPRSARRYDHCWDEAAMTPQTLVGQAWGSLDAAQRSTFRVIRAVAEVECGGQFDSINAYDRAILSAGCYHWTLCILGGDPPHVPGDGELSAFLAYLAQTEPAAFERVFRAFGCEISEAFADTFSARGSRKYSSWIKLQGADGSFAVAPREREIADWFRSWHWFHRIEMACRTVPQVQRRMWDYARMRVRDVLATPWDGTTQADGHTATIGDYYTSEKAAAMLVRMHVKLPAWVVRGGHASRAPAEGSSTPRNLRAAFHRATTGGGWTADLARPSTWGDAEEARLIQGIRDQIGPDDDGSGLNHSLDRVDDYDHAEAGRLSEDRGSFSFSGTGL